MFKRVEENIRENAASQRMNLQHFKFFFDFATDDSEKYILLDVAYEKNKYPETTMKKIKGKFLIDKEVLTAASKVLYLIKLIKNDENVIDK